MKSKTTLDTFEKLFTTLVHHSIGNTTYESLVEAERIHTECYTASNLFIIYREEYQSGRIGPLIDRLMAWTDDHQLCAKAFRTFDLRIVGASVPFVNRGEQDEQIRNYFKNVSAHWPYWLHFLKPGPENLASLLHLVFETHHVHLAGKDVRSQILISERNMVELQRLVRTTLNLHTQLQFNQRKTQQLGSDLTRSIRQILQ